MGTTTQSIIQIQITRQTQSVTRAAFNIPMVLGVHAFFPERSRVYTTLAAVAGDISTDSPLYAAAQLMFGQQTAPTQIVIGRKAVSTVQLTAQGALQANTVYSVVINGVTVSFTTDATPTQTEWSAGMLTAIGNVVPALTGFTVTDNSAGMLTFTITNPAVFSIKDTGTTTAVFTAVSGEKYSDAINAIVAYNNTWYGLTIDSHVQADVLDVAAQVEGMKKIFFTSSQDVAAQGTGTSDIGAQLKAKNYTRTMVLWQSKADTEFPENAVMSQLLQYTPGSYTAMFKSFSGITVDSLTDNAVVNLKSKNYNTYETVGGVSMLSNGVVASGEYLDVVVLVDWTDSRIRERIFFRLVNTLKIPFTRAGAALIESEIRAVYAEGVANGGYSTDIQPIIVVPDPNTLDPNLRAQRIFSGIQFTFRLAGSIHTVAIQGFVTV